MFPPPHRILYEAGNDRTTQDEWKSYKIKHEHECDFEETDAAVMCGMEDFAKWFLQWMTFTPSRSGVRIRLLMIWHSHFLTLACQQMLRRALEQRSFRCRVWFHIEEPTLQSAIVSRCIVSRMPVYSHVPICRGGLPDASLWNDPVAFENELRTRYEKKTIQ